MTRAAPLALARPRVSGWHPDVGFGARYRADLARRPARLVALCVATLVAVGVLADGADAGSAARSARAVSGRRTVGAVVAAPRPGDAAGWMATARAAAASCPGLPPEVLVATGRVETDLGRLTVVSTAGARGPMQFLPGTWAAYGVDGNGDGVADVTDPVDALHSAARLLCANGGADPARLRSALWHYNHSQEYVDQVLRVAGIAA
ncbi:MAG: lytic transglycosylase domain-containing protein [Acidimicrobiales bacterium]